MRITSCCTPLRWFEEDLWSGFDDTPGVLQVNVLSYVYACYAVSPPFGHRTGPRCSASWPEMTRTSVMPRVCGRARRRLWQWHDSGWFCWCVGCLLCVLRVSQARE